MQRLRTASWLMAAGLAFAVLPAAAAEFTQSSLMPGQTSDPRLYDINAVTITQSVSSSIVSLNSVSCNNGVNHVENSYYRKFDLNGAHGITTAFTITQVDFGIEEANAGTGVQPVTLKLYTIPNAAVGIPLGSLTPIGTAPLVIADQSLTIFLAPIAAVVATPLLSDLVVEVLTPDGTAGPNLFWIGSNAAGQSAPSYIRAPGCGIAAPVTLASIGFPGMHIYMAVTGSEAATAVAGSSWGRVKTLYR